MGRKLPTDDSHPDLYVSKAVGSRLWDTAGNAYIDFIGGMGVAAFGHSRPEVINAITSTAGQQLLMPGLGYPAEQRAAEAVLEHAPGFDWALFFNSGSEATWSASEIARRKTGRRLVAKFGGGYHGWFGGLTLGKIGNPEANFDSNSRPISDNVALLRINDLADVQAFFAGHGADVAAVIVEPVFANSGCIDPQQGFLAAVAEITRQHGALVILDQILTGFRYRPNLLEIAPDVDPDLMTLGKGIGGGVPVAALLGKPAIRKVFDDGHYITAGTYNGSPLVTAAIQAITQLATETEFAQMNRSGALLRSGLVERFQRAGIAATTSGINGAFTLWFRESAPQNYAEAWRVSEPDFKVQFHYRMRDEGVLVMPWRLGRFFVSSQHSESDIYDALAAVDRVLATPDFQPDLDRLRNTESN